MKSLGCPCFFVGIDRYFVNLVVGRGCNKYIYIYTTYFPVVVVPKETGCVVAVVDLIVKNTNAELPNVCLVSVVESCTGRSFHRSTSKF